MRIFWTQEARRSRVAAAVAALVACATARADGYLLQLNPGYTASSTTTTDEAGHESTSRGSAVSQKYRLTLDDTLYPNLSLSAGGLLDWTIGQSRTEGVNRYTDSKRWSGFGRLRAGTPLLAGALDYDHTEQESSSKTAGAPESSFAVIRESYGGSVSWKPADLPALDLRLSRSESHDRSRTTLDLTSDDALISARYEPTQDLDLRYSVRGSQTTDHLKDVVSRQLASSASATWTGRYLSGRGTAYVSYNLGALSSEVTAPRVGGTISTQQLPVEGLSVVEQFPAVPTNVKLGPNSALVDGITGGGDPVPHAGVNLGYTAATATGERPLRDLGARFADAVTPVNLVYVYVDRVVPDEQAATFIWTAYRSDNDQDWTQLGSPVIAPFNPLLNRFEIPIERSSASYLKVVTRPLATSPTTPAQLAEIFVTEIQFFLVRAAEEVVGTSSVLAGSLNATTRIQLLEAPSLAYDLTTLVTHTSASHQVTYAVTNGLSAYRRLGRRADVSGRLERSDLDSGVGHESANRWSASMSVNPLPTLGGALVYSGQYSQNQLGDTLSQSLGTSARADLYTGISLSGNASAGLSRNEEGRSTRSVTTSAGLTLSPNPVLALTSSVAYTAAVQTGAGRPEQSDRRGMLEASASFTPVRALAASGSVTRTFGGSIPAQTLVAFTAGFSPFQGGDLQLRYSYQETLDLTGEQRTRTHGPAVRWIIRRGWFADAAYTFFDARAPAQDISTRAFSANLNILLR